MSFAVGCRLITWKGEPVLHCGFSSEKDLYCSGQNCDRKKCQVVIPRMHFLRAICKLSFSGTNVEISLIGGNWQENINQFSALLTCWTPSSIVWFGRWTRSFIGNPNSAICLSKGKRNLEHRPKEASLNLQVSGEEAAEPPSCVGSALSDGCEATTGSCCDVGTITGARSFEQTSCRWACGFVSLSVAGTSQI